MNILWMFSRSLHYKPKNSYCKNQCLWNCQDLFLFGLTKKIKMNKSITGEEYTKVSGLATIGAHNTALVRFLPLPISIVLSMICNWWNPSRLWVFASVDEQTDIQRAWSSSLTLEEEALPVSLIDTSKKGTLCHCREILFPDLFIR